MGPAAIFGLSALNAGIGAMSNAISHNYSIENMRYAAELNEEAAKNADLRTRALYKDIYSPEALLKQYKQAGLSPSLMYGGTPGQGGTSGAQGGTSALNTPYAPISLIEGAQIANLAAQTEKTKAETRQIEPTAKATVTSLLAEAGYKNAAAKAAKAQATGQELQNYITEMTKEASIYTICEKADQASYEAESAYYAMKDAKLLNEFNQETLTDRIEIVKKQVEQLAQSISESKSAEKLNDQQRKYLKDAILNSIDNANREWAKYRLNTEQFETFIEKQIPILEKELDAKFQDLDIQKKKMIINAVTETFKGLAMGAMAASSMGLGKGGNLSPTPKETGLKPKVNGGNALNKGVPVYKTNNVWEY